MASVFGGFNGSTLSFRQAAAKTVKVHEHTLFPVACQLRQHREQARQAGAFVGCLALHALGAKRERRKKQSTPLSSPIVLVVDCLDLAFEFEIYSVSVANLFEKCARTADIIHNGEL